MQSSQILLFFRGGGELGKREGGGVFLRDDWCPNAQYGNWQRKLKTWRKKLGFPGWNTRYIFYYFEGYPELVLQLFLYKTPAKLINYVFIYLTLCTEGFKPSFFNLRFFIFFSESSYFWQYRLNEIRDTINTRMKSPGKVIPSCSEDYETKLRTFYKHHFYKQNQGEIWFGITAVSVIKESIENKHCKWKTWLVERIIATKSIHY